MPVQPAMPDHLDDPQSGLTATPFSVQLDTASDLVDQRDVGDQFPSTSAPPAGRRADEDKPDRADQARPVVSSPVAQGGSGEPFQVHTGQSVEGVKSRRDFEAFLRASGFPRAAAKALSAGGWPALGAPEQQARENLLEELSARIERLK